MHDRLSVCLSSAHAWLLVSTLSFQTHGCRCAEVLGLGGAYCRHGHTFADCAELLYEETTHAQKKDLQKIPEASHVRV